ncbi:hypothetical protein ONS95_008175 [Cadophora gregata]|uniref:uncharacterized protein n=1 Tax=Cadophora gregata TaxID=51156 RepID=UPI0026DDC375|nr:uncharacterized protein ONS95_008175 [Cadophora gregata]KAK0126587.1 hypothetical protein ONS95_008175 [Cadophora gregata]
MTITDDLQEIAGKEKVNIFVGPRRVRFSVHRDVICQASYFFRAAFQGVFKEAKDGSVHMPKDDPVTFKRFLAWTYAGRLPESRGTTSQRLLYDLYILAEKLCMNDLANRTIDRIKENHEHTFKIAGATDRNLKHIGHIYDHTSQRSPLRNLMLSIMGHDYYFAASKNLTGGSLVSREHLKKIWEVGQKHPDFYEDLFTLLLPIVPEQQHHQVLRPTQEQALETLRSVLFSDARCSFHKHGAREFCYLYDQDIQSGEEDGGSLSEQTSSAG